MNPLNTYPPGMVPFDWVGGPPTNHEFDGLVRDIQAHHKRQGRNVSASEVANELDAHGAKMGMHPALARGLFGSICEGPQGMAG